MCVVVDDGVTLLVGRLEILFLDVLVDAFITLHRNEVYLVRNTWTTTRVTYIFSLVRIENLLPDKSRVLEPSKRIQDKCQDCDHNQTAKEN